MPNEHNSETRGFNRAAAGTAAALLAIMLTVGCAPIENQWTEDGPASAAEWESPTTRQLLDNYAVAEQRQRDWDADTISPESGSVTHGAIYFEDPFVDKGHGREGLNQYYIGWEDYVALAYCYPRFTLNWLALPVSAAVTPPWTVMESDGEISKQALGYDHDATLAGGGSD